MVRRCWMETNLKHEWYSSIVLLLWSYWYYKDLLLNATDIEWHAPKSWWIYRLILWKGVSQTFVVDISWLINNVYARRRVFSCGYKIPVPLCFRGIPFDGFSFWSLMVMLHFLKCFHDHIFWVIFFFRCVLFFFVVMDSHEYFDRTLGR